MITDFSDSLQDSDVCEELFAHKMDPANLCKYHKARGSLKQPFGGNCGERFRVTQCSSVLS